MIGSQIGSNKCLSWESFMELPKKKKTTKMQHFQHLYQCYFNRTVWFDHISWKLGIPGLKKWSWNYVRWKPLKLLTYNLLCTPDRQRGGCIVFLLEFSVWILILHILQVTRGSYSLLQLLQVTTGYCWLVYVAVGYYRLLQVTVGYYKLVQVTKG